MGRMLEALKQIEARLPQPGQAAESEFIEQLDSSRPPSPQDSPQVDQKMEPGQAVPDEAETETPQAGGKIGAAVIPQQQEAAPSDAGEPPTRPQQTQSSRSVQSLGRADSQTAPSPIQPSQDHAGAYGELASSILSQLPPGRTATLMFTSPGNEGGKTEMLPLLAAALVQRTTGGVLLVDGNFRKPALADCLGIKATRGLGDVLTGAASWQQVVQQTGVRSLGVLPGVKSPTPDVRLPQRLNLEPLLRELHYQYRLVLIDAASPAQGEIAPIARYCDGAYLVIRLKYTTRRAVAEAVRVIEDCRGRVLGVVVIDGRKLS